MSTRVEWEGDAVADAVTRACRQGLNFTGAECVRTSKKIVPVVTGRLQGSIQMRPATDAALVVTWGNMQPYLDYALPVEKRRHYLQRSADRHYPDLAEVIGKYYGG